MRKLFFILAMFFISLPSWAESVRVVTEDLAPLNYLENGELKGKAVLMVRTVLDDLGYANENVEVLPWSRAYDIALHEKNVLIFSTARFIKRENLFHWIGVIENFDMHAYCRNDGKHENLSDEKYLKNMSVGLQNYIRPFFDLESRGYNNIVPVRGYEHGLKMLDSNRIDIIIAPKKVMESKIKELGYPKGHFKSCFHLKEISTILYLAMSKESSLELVNKFRASWQKHYPND